MLWRARDRVVQGGLGTRKPLWARREEDEGIVPLMSEELRRRPSFGTFPSAGASVIQYEAVALEV